MKSLLENLDKNSGTFILFSAIVPVLRRVDNRIYIPSDAGAIAQDSVRDFYKPE